ncbi:MAG: guanine deaminase [Burkholderiaceae bacterium]
MNAFRAAALRFDDTRAVYHSDALLVIGDDGRIADVGDYAVLQAKYTHLPVQHFPNRILAPGFVDMHIHYPQTDVIGSPADGLLPWLNDYTFPEESKFADLAHAAQTAEFFFQELLRNGVTTALTFATSHATSVEAIFTAAQRANLRLISGQVLQDRESPDGVRDNTEQSLIDTEALIRKWHATLTGQGRLGYAITPRFAPSCTPAQLRGAGELAAKYADVWIQSHVAENLEEIALAKKLFPSARSYLGVYEEFGLMRERAVYAHCIHFDDEDRARMRATGAAAAVCPTSNLFLGSGFFDYASAQRIGFKYALASDVGGGTSFSPFHTMLAAYYVGREGSAKQGVSLSPQALWWQHTQGAAQALGLDGVIGNLQAGCEADFVLLNPQATPLLARKTSQAQNLDELLFAMIVLADDRAVEQTYVLGKPVKIKA